jgi:hypothetical protein
MESLFFAVYVLAVALAFALMEIQIEGPDGWASALPTWRIENRWTRVFLGGRALTGYHFYLHIFLLLMLQLPFATNVLRPSLAIELRMFSFLILFWLVEDFLYFVLNPAFGIRKFSKANIWWHPNWWWFLPSDYWIFTPIGVALYIWSRRLLG